ncbi:hypothetical protein [Moraxella equi]|uniref:Uncharacterized protein n=1 Tax=Moraxella equi TaxID=60442 RepID=A0A378QQ24_9GAMM|nr:hypothetical protein [Moraxella equi]OPH34874.1 hypothetical protein B5J93_11630 [Moraxella equi]STZ02995.1 Uncharacterised protein [Moraxella equi]STZ03009.1 Uncharacterised protein [Moraxella equi]
MSGIPMTLEVTGAIPVDFEQHQYIKVFAQVDAKGGVGSVSQMFKYNNLKDWDKFKHIKSGQTYKANCTVSFESEGDGDKKTEIVIETIEFEKNKAVQNA